LALPLRRANGIALSKLPVLSEAREVSAGSVIGREREPLHIVASNGSLRL
jgi:hypothetical protein